MSAGRSRESRDVMKNTKSAAATKTAKSAAAAYTIGDQVVRFGRKDPAPRPSAAERSSATTAAKRAAEGKPVATAKVDVDAVLAKTKAAQQPAQLTDLETKVLALMVANTENNGGDFGVMDELNYRKLKLNAQAFGGVVTSLQSKGFVTVHEAVETNGGPKRGGERVQQFTVDKRAPQAVTVTVTRTGDTARVTLHAVKPEQPRNASKPDAWTALCLATMSDAELTKELLKATGADAKVLAGEQQRRNVLTDAAGTRKQPASVAVPATRGQGASTVEREARRGNVSVPVTTVTVGALLWKIGDFTKSAKGVSTVKAFEKNGDVARLADGSAIPSAHLRRPVGLAAAGLLSSQLPTDNGAKVETPKMNRLGRAASVPATSVIKSAAKPAAVKPGVAAMKQHAAEQKAAKGGAKAVCSKCGRDNGRPAPQQDCRSAAACKARQKAAK